MFYSRLTRPFCVLTLILWYGPSLSGQVPGAVLDYNNIAAQVNADGSLFHSQSDYGPGFQVPISANQDQHSIYSGLLWIGGETPFGQVRSAGQVQPGWQPGFQPGPISQAYDSAHAARYNRVWKVDADSLSYHLAFWMTPGYVMPEVIRHWPAHGDTLRGEARLLAPFIDLNGDGWYQPEQGEYPEINGEAAVFFMFNDVLPHQSTTGGMPMEIEVQGMVYSYGAKLDSALFESVFVHYRMVNRSSIDYSDVYMGMVVDFDIGNWGDDLVGTDVARNMTYAYNGDDLDEPFLGLGWDNVYGLRKPAQGAIFLNRSLSTSMVFTGNSPHWPYTDLEMYRNLKGYWWNGQPMLYGGDGYTGNRPTQHMFTGIPEDSSGWTDPLLPGERDLVMGTGPINLEAGSAICLDVAFPFAQYGDSSRFKSLIMLRDRADRIQAFYDAQNFACRLEPQPVVQPPTTSVFETPAPIPFRVHPSPMQDQVWLTGTQPAQGPVQALLFDLQGRQLHSWTWPTGQEQLLMQPAGLPAGTYLLTVSQGDRLQRFRLYRRP